jgi:hypothetical protein
MLMATAEEKEAQLTKDLRTLDNHAAVLVVFMSGGRSGP